MAGSATDHCSKKDARKKKVNPLLQTAVRFVAVLFVAALICTSSECAVEDVEQLQQRFDHENDGVRKAKLLQKLGDAQFDKERDATKGNDYSTVGMVMEKYRDNVRASVEALKKTHPDAEKHSAGYKQLEIHVGKGIREIRDVILAMPEQYRPPMQLVERDLKDMDLELLRLLFPRRPGERPPLQPGPSVLKPSEPTVKRP
jgi:hypothetical protein